MESGKKKCEITENEREIAAEFPKILNSDKSKEQKISELTKAGFKVEYLEEKFNRLFAAVHLGKVRLIDNVKNSDRYLEKVCLTEMFDQLSLANTQTLDFIHSDDFFTICLV